MLHHYNWYRELLIQATPQDYTCNHKGILNIFWESEGVGGGGG